MFINNVLFRIYFDKYVPFRNFYFIGMSNLKSCIYFRISSVYLFYITVHFVNVQIFKKKLNKTINLFMEHAVNENKEFISSYFNTLPMSYWMPNLTHCYELVNLNLFVNTKNGSKTYCFRLNIWVLQLIRWVGFINGSL